MKKRLLNVVTVTLLVFGQVAAGIAVMPPRASASDPIFAAYTIPTASSTPTDITVGPDGAIWFTEYSTGKVGRVSDTGEVTEYATSLVDLQGITSGPDDALWFEGAGKIGRITTDGAVTEYVLPKGTSTGSHVGIATGPDGDIWFSGTQSIYKLTTSGVFTEYRIPFNPVYPYDRSWVGDIITGPDGALWFADGYNIGRITASGEMSIYPVYYHVGQMVVGPGGNVWFNVDAGNYIGRITPSGEATVYPTFGITGGGMALGGDGALWSTGYNLNDGRLRKIDTAGTVIAQHTFSTLGARPGSMVTAPDGTIWFVERQSNSIIRASYAPIDTFAPSVTGDTSRHPNASGWYDDVTITWSAFDPEPSSGTPTTPPPTLAGHEGIHTYISEPSCDPAGNCATGSLTLSVDKTAPTIDYSLSPAPNLDGWNDSDVVVAFTCNDAVSGIASCTDPITVGEGSNQTATGTATDLAGNTATIDVTLNIDQTTR